MLCQIIFSGSMSCTISSSSKSPGSCGKNLRKKPCFTALSFPYGPPLPPRFPLAFWLPFGAPPLLPTAFLFPLGAPFHLVTLLFGPLATLPFRSSAHLSCDFHFRSPSPSSAAISFSLIVPPLSSQICLALPRSGLRSLATTYHHLREKNKKTPQKERFVNATEYLIFAQSVGPKIRSSRTVYLAAISAADYFVHPFLQRQHGGRDFWFRSCIQCCQAASLDRSSTTRKLKPQFRQGNSPEQPVHSFLPTNANLDLSAIH